MTDDNDTSIAKYIVGLRAEICRLQIIVWLAFGVGAISGFGLGALLLRPVG